VDFTGTIKLKKPKGYDPDIIAISTPPEAPEPNEAESYLVRFLGELKAPWTHNLEYTIDTIYFTGPFRNLIG